MIDKAGSEAVRERGFVSLGEDRLLRDAYGRPMPWAKVAVWGCIRSGPGAQPARTLGLYWDPDKMSIHSAGVGRAWPVFEGTPTEDLRVLAWSLSQDGKHEEVLLKLTIAQEGGDD